MEIKEYSYRFAKEILSSPVFKKEYDEIISVCKSCPLFLFSGKSKKQAKIDAVQQMINQYLKIRLTDLGWKAEPKVEKTSKSKKTQEHDDKKVLLRSDFQKEIPNNQEDNAGKKFFNIMVEVEFGNGASYYRDLFKFQRAFTQNHADVCILIVPVQSLADRTDSGLPNFEKVKRELPLSILSTTVPILTIGVVDDDDSKFDLSKYIEDTEIVKSTQIQHALLREIFINSIIAEKIISISQKKYNQLKPLLSEYRNQHKNKKTNQVIELKEKITKELLMK